MKTKLLSIILTMSSMSVVSHTRGQVFYNTNPSFDQQIQMQRLEIEKRREERERQADLQNRLNHMQQMNMMKQQEINNMFAPKPRWPNQ